MDSVGRFHREEMDGKLFLVYHHPKYHPTPKSQSQTSYGEAASHDKPFHPLFLCPHERWYESNDSDKYYWVNSSPEYHLSTPSDDDQLHPVVPLYWCNNKEFDKDNRCEVCRDSNLGTDYYFCESHNKIYHKECVESPSKIKHPYHPEHSLYLFYFPPSENYCFCCGIRAEKLVYLCTVCEFFMHPFCAMKSIPFVIDQPKRHEHPLTCFPRQTSLTCNICGLLRKVKPTYVCFICNFIAHTDCMDSPRIIKISRHHHRISYVSSLQSRAWFCGVCRQSVDYDYGAYTCDKCNDYVVHVRCALGKNVCDGEELEGILEEDDITQDDGPFDVISEGVIHHFLHNHHLQLDVNIIYDEKRLCQACYFFIYEGNIYSCMECDLFILHESCANAPRRMQHALHPHPLSLKIVSVYDLCSFSCNACYQAIVGRFAYQCSKRECDFHLDVHCASISEPFDYKIHKHLLFLALDPLKKPMCQICRQRCQKQLNCIECNFIVCFKCAILPYKARYKPDKHFLTLSYREEISDKDWCEVCECDLKDTKTTVFYWCNECCTSVHVECLLPNSW